MTFRDNIEHLKKLDALLEISRDISNETELVNKIQALVESCQRHVKWLKECAFNQYNDHAGVQEEIDIYEIALAALTTPLVPTQQWIKCSDRLPVEGQSVVIANIGHGCIYEAAAVTYYPPHFALMEGLEASNYDGGAPIHLALEATHWIALPAAPEPGGDAS